MRKRRRNQTPTACGLIVTGENYIRIEVQQELLVLDTMSWVREMIVHHEDFAEQFERHVEKSSVEFFQNVAAEIREWLATREADAVSMPAFVNRLRYQPHQVTARILRSYLCGIISTAKVAVKSDAEFLLHVDLPEPVLFVTGSLRFAAAHSGSSILGVVCSDDELAERIELATGLSS